jgi:hypothetical protein
LRKRRAEIQAAWCRQLGPPGKEGPSRSISNL